MPINKNTSSTRFYSDKHEKSICKALGGEQTANSGAGHFTKGDIIIKDADMLIEAKCCMKEKSSVSVQKAWIDKNREEGHMMRCSNQAVCINFEPQGENFYIINELLMKYLVESLRIDNTNFS